MGKRNSPSIFTQSKVGPFLLGGPIPSAHSLLKTSRSPFLPTSFKPKSSESSKNPSTNCLLHRSKMASGLSNGTRLFKGCRTLLDSLKFTTQAYSSTPAVSPNRKLKPSSATVSDQKSEAGPTRAASPSNGIMKPYPISPVLAGFLGQSEISRSEAMKKIWTYIKLHNLQSTTDKRQINCDEKLKAIFGGREKVGMLEIAKFLSPHFVKSG